MFLTIRITETLSSFHRIHHDVKLVVLIISSCCGLPVFIPKTEGFFFFFNPYKVPLYLLLVKFSRQEYWSRLPFPSPGDFLNLGIEPGSPALQADSVPSEPRGKLKRVYLSVQETWVWSLIQEDPTCCGANLHHSY